MPTTQAQWLHQVGSVLETLNQGVVISDEDRRIVFANSMFLEMSKMSAEEVLGRSVMDLYPPDEVIWVPVSQLDCIAARFAGEPPPGNCPAPQAFKGRYGPGKKKGPSTVAEVVAR